MHSARAERCRLVFGVWGVDKLGNMFRILSLSQDNSRQIKTKNCVKLPAAHSGFDTKLFKGELWVAAALWPDTIALFGVVGDRAEEPLPRFHYEYPQLPLFFGDNLLVCGWPTPTISTPCDVQELSITESRIELRRTLSHFKNYWLTSWCTVPSGLAA